jgi:hypothetical protein
MPRCKGKKGKLDCIQSVYRCKKCGAVGCPSEGCSNQNWDYLRRCKKCGDQHREEVR